MKNKRDRQKDKICLATHILGQQTKLSRNKTFPIQLKCVSDSYTKEHCFIRKKRGERGRGRICG